MGLIRTRRRRRQRHGTSESMALAIELWLRDVGVDDPRESVAAEFGGVTPDVRQLFR